MLNFLKVKLLRSNYLKVIILLTYVKWANAKGLTENHSKWANAKELTDSQNIGNAKEWMDKLANRLVDRLQDRMGKLVNKIFDSLPDNVCELHPADMDNTTLLSELASPQFTSGVSTSLWAGQQHQQQQLHRASTLSSQMKRALQSIKRSSHLEDVARGGRRGVHVKAGSDAFDMSSLQKRMNDVQEGKKGAGDLALQAQRQQIKIREAEFARQAAQAQQAQQAQSRPRLEMPQDGRALGAKLCTWFQYLLVARAICSFLVGMRFLHPLIMIIAAMTDPYLSIFRAFIPPVMGLDLSFMLGFYVITLIRQKLFKHPY